MLFSSMKLFPTKNGSNGHNGATCESLWRYLPTEGNVMILLMSSSKSFEFVNKFLESWVPDQMNMVEHVNDIGEGR
jgi:hypothetical protein